MEQIDLLTEARAASLVKAYEKSGLSFDDTALQEIRNEVIRFCHEQQDTTVGTIGEFIKRTWPGAPVEINQAVVREIVAGASDISSRIARSTSQISDACWARSRKV